MSTDTDELVSRVDDIMDKLDVSYNSGDKECDAYIKLTCAIIQADAIHDLADAVQCITTGTSKVMGIAESLHLIEEKFDNLDCGRELMEIANSLKELIHD